jgi:plastocyanin
MASSSKKPKKSPQPAKSKAESTSPARWVIVGVLLVVVVYGAYRVLNPLRQQAGASTATSQTSASSPPSGAKITGPETPGSARIVGGVQKIDIAASNVYSPNVVNLKAGIPAELTFTGGQGCNTVIHSQQLGFTEDLSTGPKTVKLKALAPGTYQFSCSMDMVFGKVVVQ